MKICIYVLTYNNKSDLNSGLQYFFESDAAHQTRHNIDLTIINNHTEFEMDAKFKPYVDVIHNRLQPNWSKGHNSRNWNQAIILGLHDLRNPHADLIVTAHDDTWWGKNWLELVENALGEGYTYMAFGLGDNIQVWTPQAIRRIGLWDERFSVLAMAEHDYFYRALWLNGEHSTISDELHGRRGPQNQHITHYAHNVLSYCDQVLQRPPVNSIRQAQMNDRERGPDSVTHLGRDFFIHKWNIEPEKTSIQEMLAKKAEPVVPTYMFYPWFERDIETLKEQKYLWNPPYNMYAHNV